MLRFVFVFVALTAVVALVSRRPGPRRVFYATAALMVIYTVLKLTGVVDALAPAPSGWN